MPDTRCIRRASGLSCYEELIVEEEAEKQTCQTEASRA